MATLFDDADRTRLLTRLDALRPDDRPRWGGLDAGRLLAHLIDAFAITFDEKQDTFKPSFFSTALGRWLVISSPLPWPKGIAVPETFFATPPEDFAGDLARVRAYIERFAAGPEQRWGVSPGFGRLSPRAWAKLSYRHCNHHLRQFGH